MGGRLDVDAEEAAQDDGGQLGGEVQEHGAADRLRADTEAMEPSHQLLVGHRAAREGTWEKPRVAVGLSDNRTSLAFVDQAKDEGVQRRGHLQWMAAEGEAHHAVHVGHVIDGQGRDVAQVLGEQQDQQPCDPVGEVDGFITEEVTDEFPAGGLLDPGHLILPDREGDLDTACVTVFDGPEDVRAMCRSQGPSVTQRSMSD
ncbi:hypothetical protein ACFZDJ_29335 [Streptomyces sp. NPDC007896]|uniref:hypothetical protein n=1 Tax=Streptomyces sp. NPDC007896 TaxID=3364784 RepID=UPI0036E63A69